MSKVTFLSPRGPISVDTIPSLNLLAHAQLEELDVGSICGGHGICGGDRILVTVSAGKVSGPTAAERERLSQSDLEAGIRLACQCFPETPDTDLKIRIGGSDPAK